MAHPHMLGIRLYYLESVSMEGDILASGAVRDLAFLGMLLPSRFDHLWSNEWLQKGQVVSSS